MVMKLSARLKAGQARSCQWNSRKSMTAPSRTRSMTLPIAPPTTRARPMAGSRAAGRGGGARREAPRTVDGVGGEEGEADAGVVALHQAEHRQDHPLGLGLHQDAEHP